MLCLVPGAATLIGLDPDFSRLKEPSHAPHHELTSSERHRLPAVGCIWRSARTSVMACLAVAASYGFVRW
jgi:hypothetical protein